MPDGHNEDIGALKTSVDFLREGQERVERRSAKRRLEWPWNLAVQPLQGP